MSLSQKNEFMRILIINGPNLNLLGTREPELYGSQSFEDFLETLDFKEAQIDYYQSNIEGELIDTIQKSRLIYDGIILNAAAYSHTSIGIADAVTAIDIPVVEVHISNIYRRENFRHFTYLASRCVGTIAGLGLKGYELAIDFLLSQK